MSKRAKEFALEAYPLEVFKGSMCDRFRSLIALGYEQAEKDLALTKEDVEALIEIWMNLPDFPARSLSQIAEETLGIFKEQREKK